MPTFYHRPTLTKLTVLKVNKNPSYGMWCACWNKVTFGKARKLTIHPGTQVFLQSI